ncbi:hypothetical protein BGZ96_009081, partial [Linnemannia gamsii]
MSSSSGFLLIFLGLCPAYFPNLTAAYVEAPFVLDFDEDFARFIRLSSSGWKRLIFHKCQELHSTVSFASEASNALLEHVPTLEILHGNFKSEIDSELVDELLSSAPNLMELYLQSDHETGCGGCFDAVAIVNSEWVCSDLEIARFTKLRELILGFPILADIDEDWDGYMDFHCQYGCLAMTVESGLDLLKGLKELRKIDLTNIEVYIDNETEQRWFKENWPQAKVGCAEDFMKKKVSSRILRESRQQ